MDAEPILIIGAGQIGEALGRAFQERGERVVFWDNNPAKMRVPLTLEDAVKGARIIIFCVPTVAYDTLLLEPALNRQRDHVDILALSKGLLENGETIDSALEKAFGSRYALLAGPMIAEEINRGKHSFAMLATRDHDLALRLRSIFAGSRICIDESSDVRGVAMAAVLKNVYTVLLGIADGLSLGANVRGWMVQRIMREMQVILRAAGGDPKSVWELCGLGDLVATGTSRESHNHETGRSIAQGNVDLWMGGEGIRSLTLVRQRYGEILGRHSLLALLEAIVMRSSAARAVTEQYLKDCFPAQSGFEKA